MDEQMPQPGQEPTAPVAPEPVQVPERSPRRRGRLIIAGCALAALGVGSGIALGVASSNGRTVAGQGSITADGPSTGGTVLPRYGYPGGGSESGNPWGGGSLGSGGDPYGTEGGQGDSGQGDSGQDGSGQTGSGQDGSGQDGSGQDGSGQDGSGQTGSATAAQQVGVVDIVTVLNYGEGQAAGTGTVMSADGEILTNNHVIDDATKITVTVVSTGRSYSATVVGTDPTDDVAVLQLSGASGLKTANYGDSDSVSVGDTVVGVGNAGGTGGTPSAATGTVTALNRQITASDEDGSDSETLTGLIETNAGIQAGDSGGPLYDASGKIVGMNTAAQTIPRTREVPPGVQTVAAYAITIDHALDIAKQIESASTSTSTIHVGYPAFLGVAAVSTGGSGAGVEQVISGTPAASAGLEPGDVITAVDGTEITSPEELSAALAKHRPGDQVEISWTDSYHSAHNAQVTLAKGPAD